VASPTLDLPSARDRATGLICAVLCSLGLGLAVALGPVAFDGGATPLSVALCRSVFSIGFMASLCLVTGQSLKPPKGAWPHLLFLGLLFAHMAFGNIGSTKYIPVSLAALLFFVYPPVVALINTVLDRRPPGLVKIVSMLTAFAGLAVMLGVGFEGLDARGVIIGLTSGIACAINIVWVTRRTTGLHPFVIVFYQSSIAAVVMLILAVQLDELRFPNVGSGWWGLGLIVVLQSCSISLFYFAIQRIGPERTAMLNNLQPVASIIGAIFLFQEFLTTERALGAMMVLGGILLMQWNDSRNRRGEEG
jgi:drug/metabolite transporter (DMT)-like permease